MIEHRFGNLVYYSSNNFNPSDLIIITNAMLSEKFSWEFGAAISIPITKDKMWCLFYFNNPNYKIQIIKNFDNSNEDVFITFHRIHLIRMQEHLKEVSLVADFS